MPEMLIDISWKEVEASMLKAAEDFLVNRKPQLRVRRGERGISLSSSRRLFVFGGRLTTLFFICQQSAVCY